MVKYLQEDYSRIKSILENQYLVETASKFQIIISFSRPCGTDHFWFFIHNPGHCPGLLSFVPYRD